MHPVPRIWEFRQQGHMINNKVYTLPRIEMVVRIQEKKYSKVVIRVMILIFILKIKKKYMRNKRLL